MFQNDGHIDFFFCVKFHKTSGRTDVSVPFVTNVIVNSNTPLKLNFVYIHLKPMFILLNNVCLDTRKKHEFHVQIVTRHTG